MKQRLIALMQPQSTRIVTTSMLLVALMLYALPAFAQETEAVPRISILIPLFSIGLYSLFILFNHNVFFRDYKLHETSMLEKRVLLIGAALGVGFLLRLYLAATNEGYVNDLALFHYWGNYAFREGLLNLYHGDFFLDYPPGYIYVLYVIAALQHVFQITYGGAEFLVLYKLPTLLIDIIASYYIYKQAIKKLSFPISFGLMLLYLFNPVVLLDGAVWGQVDSIFTLLIVVSIGLFIDGKMSKASFVFALAALTKPQAFIFMPVVLLALLYSKRWRAVATCAAWGFGTFLLFSLPLFLRGGGLLQLIDLYRGTLSSYSYATLNAFNSYMLLNFNWVSNDHTFAGVPLAVYGMLAVFAAVAYAAYIGLMAKAKHRALFFVGAALIVIVFMFVTKMHERYMFAAIMLLIMAFIQSGDRRLLYISYGFTMTNTLNLYVVLAFSTTTTFVPNDGVAILCSIANVVMTLFLLYVGHDVYVKERIKRLQTREKPEQLESAQKLVLSVKETEGKLLHPWRHVGMTRKDWIIVSAVTAVYIVLALVNLGSMNSPKTVWQPATNNDYIVFDLGESKPLQRVISFGGVGSGEYRYSFSNDGVNWNDEQTINHDHVAVFLWKEADIAVTARYMKLQAAKTGFSLHEIGIFEQGSETPLSLRITDVHEPQGAVRGAAAHLIDEQTIVPYHHTYMVGSYFDEIYHARTAYEHLEGLKAYESTHPPLGKLLIAIGIQLFGLSPFGWRIVGALCGAAMLPIIYMMAKAILRKTSYATGAMLLYAVDFMHFTQTRIATIDVYAVLFIMLMFYYMNRYFAMNFYRDWLLKTFVPLGLAGMFFGLGTASKWIVLYGGAGLAIMLLISLIRRYLEYRSAGLLLRSGDGEQAEGLELSEQARSIRRKFVPYTISTIAVCVLFYIVIPFGIYALANIPVLKPLEGGFSIKALIDYQVNMFNYHSNLVSAHPFSSTWWEWPFMKRPVWYFLDSAPMVGMRSTIAVLGNPLIWWIGIFTMLATTIISIRRNDQMAWMLGIAYFSQYVPWMLVPRETFLYHYFAMVPFMIVSILYIFKLLEEKYKWSRYVRYAYISAAVVLFVMFYPVLSGMPAPESYIMLLRWFPSWVF